MVIEQKEENKEKEEIYKNFNKINRIIRLKEHTRFQNNFI